MADGLVATMSTLGFIIDSMPQKIDRHFSYYFAAFRNQCKIVTQIQSFSYLRSRYDGNKDLFFKELQNDLENYFKEIADNAQIVIGSNNYQNDPSKKGIYTLVIKGRIQKNNLVYDLQKTVEVEGDSYRVVLNDLIGN